MKKIFLIFGTVGALSVNNAYAVISSADAVVEYTCPAGCELHFFHNGLLNSTIARCEQPDGTPCADPAINIRAIAPTDFEPINFVPQSNTKPTVQKRQISARTATTEPKMVKKIVYEQVIEDEE